MSGTIIKEEIREYLKKGLLQNDTLNIENDTPLISGGLVDSISTLKLVDFLEKKYKIEFAPHEVDRENLDTINLIEGFISSKM